MDQADHVPDSGPPPQITDQISALSHISLMSEFVSNLAVIFHAVLTVANHPLINGVQYNRGSFLHRMRSMLVSYSVNCMLCHMNQTDLT